MYIAYSVYTVLFRYILNVNSHGFVMCDLDFPRSYKDFLSKNIMSYYDVLCYFFSRILKIVLESMQWLKLFVPACRPVDEILTLQII